MFNGVPNDQIHPEVTCIVHTIDTCTGHIGLTCSYFWWARQFHKYMEKPGSKVSNNNSQC